MKRKIMLVLTCAALILASLAFVACDNNKTAANDPRANANILVVDTLMQPLQGATVALNTATDGQAVKSNVDGVATFANLKVGVHQAKVTMDGYAPMFVNFEIKITNDGDTPVASTTGGTAVMSKLGASVAGKAEIFKSGKYVPLQNAELKLKIDTAGFAKVLYETTSDKDGNYTFTDLPENVRFSILGAKTLSDGVIYVTNGLNNQTTGYIWDGTTRIIDTVKYQPEAEQFVVTSGRELVMTAINTPIVVDFSLSVDLESLEDGFISVSGNHLVDRVWSNNNKRLTITPVSGSWNSTDITVTLDGSIKSTLGIELASQSFVSISHKMTVNNALANVGTITITADSNMHDLNKNPRNILKLQWSAVTGATAYDVYYRTNSADSYDLISSSVLPVSGNIVTLDLSGSSIDSSLFVDGSHVEIIVYASNSTGRSQKGTTYTIDTIALVPVS